MHSLILVLALVADGDYQILKNQTALDDEMESGAYNVRDVDSFKARAMEKAPAPIPQSSQASSIDTDVKIKKVLDSFGKKIDPALKAELEKSLKAEFSAQAASHEVKDVKSDVQPKQIQMLNQTQDQLAKPVVAEQPKVTEQKAEVRIGDQKTVGRIAEINKALANPQLEWAEFEKLLEERRVLEQQLVKGAAATANPVQPAKSEKN